MECPEQEICVETPHGVLRAFINGVGDYPGIRINLKKADGSEVGLALVEYTETEPVGVGSDAEEVPFGRKREKSVAPGLNTKIVTPGIITRAWPNECAAPDQHRRVIHTGYLN